ncbi:MAG: DUF3800 domain-containing protein [Dehalococcoidia bacterium]|nr:DUF3800 domain-containing protein [Dehalococcoidia bacterium]
MAKNDFIFVDESGDTGYKLDPETGELLSSPYYVLAALHVTDESIRWINRHVAAFRFYTGFSRELKFPPEREMFTRLLEPIQEMTVRGVGIHASVVYLDKQRFTGDYLKPGCVRPQSTLYFRNRVLRCLLEFHFSSYGLISRQYELILDRIDMTPGQVRDLDIYLRNRRGLMAPRLITQADSIYVEGLQVVDNIASGFKNVVGGVSIPESLLFVNAKDVTEDMDIVQKNEGHSSSRALWEPD